MPPKPIKIAIITDIQIGTDKPQDGHCKTLPSRALSLLKYLVTRINNEVKPACVIRLGNLVDPEDAETDEEYYEKAVDAFKQLTMPVHHVVGNLEQVNLDLKQIGAMLNCKRFYYSFDLDSFHIIVLFSNTSNDQQAVHIDKAQLKWLAEDLNTTNKNTVAFIHHPVDDQDLTGNFIFEQNPGTCFVEERAEIRKILSDSGKVRAVFSGHVHDNNLQEINGIHYVTLQSLVKNMAKTGKTPSESFAVLNLSEREIRVEIEGLDPAEFRISI